MKTIHPIGLATLMARHEPVEVIDVRTREEFHKAHIPGARCIPLPELRGFNFLHHRKLAATEPIYIVCRSHALASLASGALEGAGCPNAVVVDGGMEVWGAERLPVLRGRRFPKVSLDAPLAVVIAGLGLGLALAVHEIFLLVPLAVGFGALFMSVHSFARRQAPQGHAAESSPVGDWTVPHLSLLMARLRDEQVLSHPHHRVLFATPH